MLRSSLVRFGELISTKRNFLLTSVLVTGLPFGILEAFLLGTYGPVPVVLAVLLGPVFGLLWGLAMWHLVFKAIYARRTSRSEQSQ